MWYVLLIMGRFSILQSPASGLRVGGDSSMFLRVLCPAGHSSAVFLSQGKHFMLVLVLLEPSTARNGGKAVATPPSTAVMYGKSGTAQ